MKKSNDFMRKEVIENITWQPHLNSPGMQVSVVDGIAALAGSACAYSQKMEAEDAVNNDAAIRTIVNDIKPKIFSYPVPNDLNICSAVLRVLKENWAVPKNKLKVTVKDGWVILTGILIWNFQRKIAVKAVRNLEGVKGVIDEIKNDAEAGNERDINIVRNALSQSWILDIGNIKVKVDRKTVFLSGIVSSLFQKEEAERIALLTPGIWYVDNELVVERD